MRSLPNDQFEIANAICINNGVSEILNGYLIPRFRWGKGESARKLWNIRTSNLYGVE